MRRKEKAEETGGEGSSRHEYGLEWEEGKGKGEGKGEEKKEERKEEKGRSRKGEIIVDSDTYIGLMETILVVAQD